MQNVNEVSRLASGAASTATLLLSRTVIEIGIVATLTASCKIRKHDSTASCEHEGAWICYEVERVALFVGMCEPAVIALADFPRAILVCGPGAQEGDAVIAVLCAAGAIVQTVAYDAR